MVSFWFAYLNVYSQPLNTIQVNFICTHIFSIWILNIVNLLSKAHVLVIDHLHGILKLETMHINSKLQIYISVCRLTIFLTVFLHSLPSSNFPRYFSTPSVLRSSPSWSSHQLMNLPQILQSIEFASIITLANNETIWFP